MKRKFRTGLLTLAAGLVIAGLVYVLYPVTDSTSPITNSGGGEKTIRLRIPSFALVLHPAKMADVESRRVATLMHAGLVLQDQEGKIHPVLADSWTHSGNTWEFILKPNITFSNGMPVRAEDVSASLCAFMQPTSPWAWALASIDHIKTSDGKVDCRGIQVLADDRIKITEVSPAPWFLDAISSHVGWILPAGDIEESPYGVVPGAGAYQVREIVPDVKVVLEARSEGSSVKPGAQVVQFDYIPDDAVAASRFSSGELDLLDLTSPLLVNLLVASDTRKLKYPGKLVERKWERMRVAIINKERLRSNGMTSKQIGTFVAAFSESINRSKLAEQSHGIGEPLHTLFSPSDFSDLDDHVIDIDEAERYKERGDADMRLGKNERAVKNYDKAIELNPDYARTYHNRMVALSNSQIDQSMLPESRLTVITEPDSYSDLIAASIAQEIGPVSITYKNVDKGVLISSWIEKDYDIVSMIIESPIHSAQFWKSFFTPGDPLAVFGFPIEELANLDVTVEEDLIQTIKLISTHGNWVPILQEKRIQAVAPGISGVKFTRSGQTNFLSISKE